MRPNVDGLVRLRRRCRAIPRFDHGDFRNGDGIPTCFPRIETTRRPAQSGDGGSGPGQVEGLCGARRPLAKRLGLATTPSFVVDGIRNGGEMSFAQFKLLIDAEFGSEGWRWHSLGVHHSWGRPPGLRPTPSSAFSRLQADPV
jgi:hypothetical protein